MDPWGQVSSAFLGGFNDAQDKRYKKKMAEQELKQKMQLMQMDANLQNQALTPEQKLMMSFKQDPNTFSGFNMARDPYEPQKIQLSRDQFLGNLGVEKGKLGLMESNSAADNAYKKWQMNRPPELTPQMQNLQGLMGQGVPADQARSMIFPPHAGGGAAGIGPTSQQRNYSWLMSLPGMTQEKALQMIMRPDMMAQFGGALNNLLNQNGGSPSIPNTPSQGWDK